MRTLKWFGFVLISFIGVGLGVVIVPFQVAYRFFSGKYDLWYYFKQIAVANDVTVGSLVFGSKHTVSAITGYKAFKNERFYIYLEWFIDSMFGDGHCNREAWGEGLVNNKLIEENLNE